MSILEPGHAAQVDQTCAVILQKYGEIAGAVDTLDEADAVAGMSALLRLQPKLDRDVLASAVATYAVRVRRQADTLNRGRKVNLHAESVKTMAANLAALPWWAWRRRQNIRYQLAAIAVGVVDPAPYRVEIRTRRAAGTTR